VEADDAESGLPWRPESEFSRGCAEGGCCDGAVYGIRPISSLYTGNGDDKPLPRMREMGLQHGPKGPESPMLRGLASRRLPLQPVSSLAGS